MATTIDLCSLCSRSLSDACERCQDYSGFRPDVPDTPKRVLGMEDLASFSARGKLAVLLYLLAQPGERG